MPSGWRRTCCGERRRSDDLQPCTITQRRWACTRGRPRSSSTRRAASRRTIRVARATARWTGRASWACCCWPPARGTGHRDHGRWHPTRSMRSRRSARWSSAASTRRRSSRPEAAMRLTGLGVSPGHRHRPGARVHAGQPGLALPHPGGAGRAELAAARHRARTRSRDADRSRSSARIAAVGRRRARLPVRRPAADARRSRCWSTAPAAIIRGERLNAESALQRALEEVAALFDKRGRSVSARAQGRRRRRRRPAVA